MRGYGITALGLVALTACGPAAAQSAPATAAELAAKGECIVFTVDDPLEMYVKTGGTCTKDGAAVHVMTFATDDARDSYVKVASLMGASGTTEQGHLWVVNGDVAAAVSAVAKANG